MSDTPRKRKYRRLPTKNRLYAKERLRDVYIAAPVKPTLKQMADREAVALSTVKYWLRTEDWRAQRAEFQARVQQQATERLEEQAIEDECARIQHLQAVTDTILARTSAAPVRDGASDLGAVVRAQTFLDEATGRRQVPQPPDPAAIFQRLVGFLEGLGYELTKKDVTVTVDAEIVDDEPV